MCVFNWKHKKMYVHIWAIKAFRVFRNFRYKIFLRTNAHFKYLKDVAQIVLKKAWRAR